MKKIMEFRSKTNLGTEEDAPKVAQKPNPQPGPPPPSEDLFSTKTAHASNLTKEGKRMKKIAQKYAVTEKKLEEVSTQLEEEKKAKRKLYQTMIRIVQELKTVKDEQTHNLEVSRFQSQKWYDGGIWRSPEINPRVVVDPELIRYQREPLSLTGLFFDLVTITAFSKVGEVIANEGKLSLAILAYFAVFWLIWLKESSYATRFDTPDLTSQIETLFTCLAVLYATFSVSNEFTGTDSKRIMIAAAFVSFSHFLLHARIAFWFRNAAENTYGLLANKYSTYVMLMTSLETIVWLVGIFLVPEHSSKRWIVFLFGILFSLRIPRVFLANDFHSAGSKRGILFLLQLGFLLQNIMLVASPFFQFKKPSLDQYAYLGSICFLLFCIRLLYVDNAASIHPKDHALIVNKFSGFLFQCGQFALLLSTTVLGSGLDLLTHYFLAPTEALSGQSRRLVTGGFSAVVLSLFIIKSMHVRRVPINTTQKFLFFAAFGIEASVFIAIIVFTGYVALSPESKFLALNELEMISMISVLALFAVMTSWLDEAIEMSLFESSSDAQQYRVSPFGFFTCCLKNESADSLPVPDTGESSTLTSPLMMEYDSVQEGSENLPVNKPTLV